MIIKTTTTPILFCIYLLSTISIVQAAPFVNGNFNAGLAGWDIDGDASLNGGQVELSTIGPGGFFADASLIQGDFFSGADSIQLGATDNFLNFDIWYQDLGAGGSSGSVFSDALLVSVADEFGTGATDLFFDSEFDFLLGATFASVSLDISSLAGLTIGLFFDVFNEDDGRDSLFTLDNISFSETPAVSAVPIPGALVLMFSGLMGLMGFVGRVRKKNT